jgi:hypothetical protein
MKKNDDNKFYHLPFQLDFQTTIDKNTNIYKGTHIMDQDLLN